MPHLSKKAWIVGVSVLVLAVGATVAGAVLLTRPDKEALLAEKQAEAEQLRAEYVRLAEEGDESAYVVGNEAKDLAPVIEKLQAEVGEVTDEWLQMSLDSQKAAVNDNIAWALQQGFSEEYINSLKEHLQELEALEQEFAQHTRSNQEIQAELDALSKKWTPIHEELLKAETQAD